MILLQKETEKLARTAFAKISRDRPSSVDENKVVLEWCMGSISILLRVMPMSAVKCLNRRIKDYARHGGSEVKDTSAQPLQASYDDYEMLKQQDDIDNAMDKIRNLIRNKQKQSDKLIDQCGEILRKNCEKLSKFKAQLSELKLQDVSLTSAKNSESVATNKAQEKLQR